MREVATADGTARTRILDAACARMLEAGEGGASSAQVAAAAGVSKALVHYHFRDKRELLLGVTTACGERIAGRTGVTTDAASPLDAFWQWLERELNAGDLRLLLQLTQGDDDAVGEAAVGELQVFRVETQRRVRRVFRALALAPSIPVELVTELVVVAAMGLAAGDAAMSDDAGRQAIDVLWLGLLGLGA
ncbi:MAG TPA: TetR family transcriptional regulator [Gemmatimonadaceae bacterium]|nr:TetR family transcriptional regulator [Gemmatimonadaceae bacterium]